LPNIQPFLKVAFIVIFALLGFHEPVQAEQLNNTVKDYFDHPEKYKDTNIAPKSDSQKQAKASPQVGVTIWDFLRMILALAFVIALLYFLLKFINKRNKVYKNSQLVENLGGTSLGANRSIQIIKAGNQLLIVGVGESIQLLKEIDDPEEYRHIIEEYNNKMEQLVQPSDIVTKVLKRAKNFQTGKNESTSFSSVLKTKMGEMSSGRKKLFDELEKERQTKNE
jgi:flagellar protein FliO/FliZ